MDNTFFKMKESKLIELKNREERRTKDKDKKLDLDVE